MDRTTSLKILEKGNGFRYPFLFACMCMLISCHGQDVTTSEKEPFLSDAVNQKDNTSNKIFISIDSLEHLYVNEKRVLIDSLASDLQRNHKAIWTKDSTKPIVVTEVHPDAKMGIVTDLKRELWSLTPVPKISAKIKYEKSP